MATDQDRDLARHVPAGILNRARMDENTFPLFMERAKGPYVWGRDGTRYVDWVLGKGPVTLGHAEPAITAAIVERLEAGFQLTMAPTEYGLLATALSEKLRCAEKSIFFKNGTDAVKAAMRIARAYTGKEIIAFCGYHSWQDEFVLPAWPFRGISDRVRSSVVNFGYNLRTLERLLEERHQEIAAILVTPEPGFFDGEFLHAVERLARQAGVLFIMDEVKCGYHLALGGATEHNNLTPDLVTVSKGMGNGYPISATLGNARIMDASDQTFLFGSYFYDGLGLAAALAVLRIFEERDVIGHMWRTGRLLLDGLDALFEEVGIQARTLGPAPLPHILFEDERAEAVFFKRALKEGVLLFPRDNQCSSMSHTEVQVAETLEACRRAAEDVRQQVNGGSRSANRQISAGALRRYELKRLIEPGLCDLEVIHRPARERWPAPHAARPR